MTISKVNLQEKFGLFSDHWSPKLAGTINNFAVKLAKVQGEFDWHHHPEEDEFFMVIDGQLTIQLRDQDDIVLNPGEFVVIPHGVEHKPIAAEETQIMMIERETTLNTGNVRTDKTVENLDTI